MPKFMIENEIDPGIVQFWKVWMNALRQTNPKLLAYLSYMVERLVQMKIILKPTGSIYLHCDPTYSHYIKIIMDGIFGQENFRNEIVWCYSRPSAPSQRQLSRVHDIILWYSKGSEWIFNPDDIRQPYAKSSRKREGYVANTSKVAQGSVQLDKNGKFPESWIEIPPLKGNSHEYLGYPTQKPLKLLHRIIKASSNPGNIVFDPFCGCGTTLEAAQQLKRGWIGIDIAIHAIKRVAAIRLNERCQLNEDTDYEITGIPRSIEGAEDRWKRDPYHFQKWAVEMVGGFVTANRSRDGGIDGRLYFPDGDDLKSMVLEVKGGSRVELKDLRALAGVLHDEDSPLAGLIIRKPFGRVKKRNFDDACRDYGDVEINGKLYPRLQIITVPDILEDKTFEVPGILGKRESNQELINFSNTGESNSA